MRKLLAVVGAAGLMVAGSLVLAAPAAAHVSVHADEAIPGEMAYVVFRVPNESDTRHTSQVQVHLRPEGGPPVPTAQTTPVPGWQVEVEVEELAEPVTGAHGEEVDRAVSAITWTATGDGLPPGEFADLPVLLGPLPEADVLFFPALQWYEGADEPVRWIAPPEPDGTEPSNPAPVLRLTTGAAGPQDPDAGPQDPDAGPQDPDAGPPEAPAAEPDRTGVWLGLAGLVAGLAALAVAGLALSRTRR